MNVYEFMCIHVCMCTCMSYMCVLSVCVCMYKCACVYCVSVLHVCMSVHEYACVYISVYMCVLYKCV